MSSHVTIFQPANHDFCRYFYQYSSEYCSNLGRVPQKCVFKCDGPKVTLFIHITSFTKNDEKYGSFYIYDYIYEKLTKNMDVEPK